MYNLLHKFHILHKFDRYFINDNSIPFKVVDSFYKRSNFTIKAQRNGRNLSLPIINGIGILNFVSHYEDWWDNIFDVLAIPEETTFVDVGANTGQTLLKIAPFHQDMKYIAIEPNVNLIPFLGELGKSNNLSNVQIYNYALSDKDELVTLYSRYREDILATTTPEFRQFTNYSNKQKISAVKGDDLFEKNCIENVSIIKIDVEGGEYKVLRGLINTITEYKPFIVCEILPTMTESFEITKFRENNVSGLFTLLQELNYSILNIGLKSLILKSDDFSQNIESCNYIMCPKEKTEVLLSRLESKL